MVSKNKKGKSQLRTVNVSADGGPTHTMTPEAAAKYLQHATTQSNNREVKISFGPSRPPRGLSFGSLDLQALKETAAAAQRGSCNGDGLPCSEAEMKALMGMFVEIMGMSMDGAKQNVIGSQPPHGSNWPDQESLAAATAGFFADGASWEALRRTYGAVYNSSAAFSNEYEEEDDDDDDDENESIPDLDAMREVLEKRGTIAPGDWDSLEKVAVEDALQAEERARKVAKKREKKQRRKQKQKEEAVTKAAEAARKKREKSMLSWRSRVVSACQAGELPKLEVLLQESPLSGKKTDHDDDDDEFHVFPHLEFLLSNAIAKNRNQLERGKETRHRLASFLLSEELQLAFIPMRSGRSPMHIACFQGDVAFVELVLHHLERNLQEYPKNTYVSREDLNVTCEDSGWTALHYAAVSGSAEVLELILRSGCNVKATTDETHTWRMSDGKGISPRELIEYIKAGTYDDEIESHGVALQELQSTFLGNATDRRSYNRILEAVLRRLKDVEVNGYIAPGLLEQATSCASEEGAGGTCDHTGFSDGAAKKRKKKKKKKKASLKESEESEDEGSVSLNAASTTLANAKEPTEDFEDPLVVALLGMGFTKDQISAAVKACGGTNRATADDLVTWILGQDADGGVVNETTNAPISPLDIAVEVNETTVVKTRVIDEMKLTAEEMHQDDNAAKRLAEKREERRRRYREWNNKEQARQQQQANAKLAQILAPIQAPSATTLPNYTLSSLEPSATSVNPGLGAKAVVPQPQTGIPLKSPPQPSYQTPILAASNEISQRSGPTGTNPKPMKSQSVARMDDEFPALSQSVTMTNQATAQKVRVTSVAAAPVMTSHNSFPPIGDDEKTVSSFGSNKGLSVSSAPFLPPGISPSLVMQSAPPSIPPSAIPPGLEPLLKDGAIQSTDPVTGSSQSSEIRATAKEFVPMGYTSSTTVPAHLVHSSVNSAPLPLSANFASGLGVPFRVSLPEVSPAFENSTVPLSQGFLSSSGPSQPIHPPYVGIGSNGYEKMPVVAPLSEDASTATTSIGSSLTGIPGLDDSTLNSGLVPLGLGLEMDPSSGNTASLLTSAFTNGPTLSVASLWGGETTSLASTSLSGLPLAFSSESNEDGRTGNEHSTYTWGAPSTHGGGLTGAQGGSIW